MRDVERQNNKNNKTKKEEKKRSATERTQLLTPNREEDSARRATQGTHGSCGARDIDPEGTVNRLPRWPPQTQIGGTRFCRRHCGVGGNLLRVRMCSVDQKIDVVGAQILGESRRASETTNPHGNSLRGRRGRSASPRNRNSKRPSTQSRGQLESLGRATQNQDVGIHVC